MSALPNLVEDGRFQPALSELIGHLRTELDAAGGPGLCFCGLVPAGQPPLGVMNCDTGACGVAWIAAGAVFPTYSFPERVEGPQGFDPTCRMSLGMDITIGVARCFPRPRGREPRPDEQAYFESTRLVLSDMRAMLRAMERPIRNGSMQVVPVNWGAMEPTSGATGGIWTAMIG